MNTLICDHIKHVIKGKKGLSGEPWVDLGLWVSASCTSWSPFLRADWIGRCGRLIAPLRNLQFSTDSAEKLLWCFLGIFSSSSSSFSLLHPNDPNDVCVPLSQTHMASVWLDDVDFSLFSFLRFLLIIQILFWRKAKGHCSIALEGHLESSLSKFNFPIWL